MTDHVALQSRIDAQSDVIRCLECEIEQLKRALRITRKQNEDLAIELDRYRSSKTIPAPSLSPESLRGEAESAGEREP